MHILIITNYFIKAFSSIPYEKGSQFLFYLESKVSSPKEFEDFFREWIITNKFKSVTTEDFQNFFKEKFGEELYNSIDWNTWLYSPGMPPVDLMPQFDDSLAISAKNLASSWINGTPGDAKEFNDLASNQKEYFFNQLIEQSPSGLPHETLRKMDELYSLTNVKNSEVKMGWLTLCLKSKDQSCFQEAAKFVSEQGRMKFVR